MELRVGEKRIKVKLILVAVAITGCAKNSNSGYFELGELEQSSKLAPAA